MKAAARVVAYGKPYECDLGLFNKETYFTYVAAFGIFTETSYQTPQDLKNQLGHLAYVLQGMMDLGKARTYRFHVESDEFSVTDNFVFGMITNSKSVGGFPDITGSEVDMNDGLFEVTPDTSDMVYRFKTSHLVLESDEPVNWTRDGEYGGVFKRVEIDNLHRAMKIIAPGEFNMAGVPDTP